MKHLIAALTMGTLLLGGCMQQPIHQGNRLAYGKVLQIQEGDSKFRVEQMLGSPMLDSTLHPNRVTYYEEFEDEESGDMVKRGVEIVYDEALRVKSIREFGFEDKQ
ncbi:Outer membrane protein assembly factor BamE, lipoprotein component of the BamABCDE complex [Mariprofundus ferrinatatus]|uniref:Outer membrane protein assembly factor BamE, lipoprotein component of the BamABCDE complex n=1 Tax=Mariprofundus ferrinatatus TaxID=1921087 RepID=A0A2K8L3B9_9PROT|nr:outer membrane protein assembly factor BamE [Mariprofundus ferrinatatus]ATX81830.1 Outer membrane protein assembly factor BamE, lipoprotein component of the BamABCDE complex [Mariprofundus ferrinatatus]